MSIGKFTFKDGAILVNSTIAKNTPTLTDVAGLGVSVAKTQLFALGQPDGDEPQRTSYLGTPVFSNLEIKPFKYDTLEGETIEIKNGIVIDTVLMAVSQSKNIVTTPIQGRNGTVKEYISDGDYQIDINGMIVSEGNKYPESEVNELIQILKSPVAISFISEFLNWFDIHDVVVESFDFPQTEGVRNAQQFTISCLSDTPVELLNDND